MKTFILGFMLTALSGSICAAQAEGSFDRSLTVSGSVDLDVKTDAGGITIVPGSSLSFHVHAILKAQQSWLNWDDAEAHIRELERNPPVEQTGNRIRIGYVSDRSLLRGVSMRLEIETPPNTQVRAHADSGGIHVDGVHGPLDCHTDSGGIEIRDAGSEVHATADSGGIRINRVNGPVTARVDSGGIEALDVAGSIDAQSDSGSIRLSQTSAGTVRAKADSGGVHLRLAPGAGYDVSISTESGNISVPEMTVRSEFSRHHVEGKVKGGGPLVSIHVDSGGVTVE